MKEKVIEYQIGETFDFGKMRLKVIEQQPWICEGCVFDEDCPMGHDSIRNKILGSCDSLGRTDQKDVIFVEV